MKSILRALLLATLLVTAGAAPATANHQPGCSNQGNNEGNNANPRASGPPQYTGGSSDVVADDSQGAAGEEITVHGCGFAPNSRVDHHMRSEPIFLGFSTTDSFGSFTTKLKVPAGAPVGAHTITSSGLDPQGKPKVESFAFTVVTPAAAQNARNAAGGTLPRTGNSTTVPLVAGSTVLLGLGAALVIVARRRGATA